MNCEKAEEFLSAYLDETLDSQQRRDVEAHLSDCTACRTVLDEYRRFDLVLAHAPRIAPPDELHDRIFESPEFAALLRSLEEPRPTGITRMLWRGAAAATPTAPDDASETPTTPRAAPRIAPAAARRGPPGSVRVALQAAAVLVLVLGSALLIKQGLFTSAPTSQSPGTRTIGAPSHSTTPLAAGLRIVTQHDGALWSAPADGSDLAQRLTPSSARVGGWSVSPDGTRVAYIDERTGTLQVIRSDDQNNQTIGHVASATQVRAGLWTTAVGSVIHDGIAWAPDGQRIVYIAAGSSAATTTVRLVNDDGSNDIQLAGTDNTSLLSQPRWSRNALLLAYVQTATTAGNATQSIWTYDLVAKQNALAVPQADPADRSARVDRLIWLPDTLHPTLTWAARSGTTLTGLFAWSQRPNAGADGVHALTPQDATLTAADYSAANSGGAWSYALGGASPSLNVVAVSTATLEATQAPSAAVPSVVWSPAGTSVAYRTSDGAAHLWSLSGTDTLLASRVTGAPAWSSDGTALAFPTPVAVVSMKVSAAGVPDTTQRVISMPSVAGDESQVLWSPDGASIAVATSQGTTILTIDGTRTQLVDGQSTEGHILAWTLAR